MRRISHAVGVRVSAQAAVGVGADAVVCRADGGGADGPRAVRECRGCGRACYTRSARGDSLDGEGVRLVAFGCGEGDVTWPLGTSSAAATTKLVGQGRGRSHRRAEVVAGERVGLEELVVEGDPGHRAWCRAEISVAAAV